MSVRDILKGFEKIASENPELAEKVAADLLEKISFARRWKDEVGGLSPEAHQRLVDSGVLDYNRELNGLERGTENLFNAHNTVRSNYTNPEDLGKVIYGNLKDSDYVNSLAKVNYTSTKDLANSIAEGQAAGGYNYSSLGVNANKAPHHNKGISLTDQSLPYAGNRNLTDFDKRYIDAIVERHEADEIRHGIASQKNPMRRVSFGNHDIGTTAVVGGHLSPKVVMRESANVAPAPENVKDFMNGIRDTAGERMGYKAYYGLDYGKSGNYAKAMGNAAEKVVSPQNKAMIEQTFKVLPQPEQFKSMSSRILSAIKKMR